MSIICFLKAIWNSPRSSYSCVRKFYSWLVSSVYNLFYIGQLESTISEVNSARLMMKYSFIKLIIWYFHWMLHNLFLQIYLFKPNFQN